MQATRKTKTKQINGHYDIAFFFLINFLSSVVEDTPLPFNALPVNSVVLNLIFSCLVYQKATVLRLKKTTPCLQTKTSQSRGLPGHAIFFL